MSSSVSGLGSFDPSWLINSLTAPVPSATTSASQVTGVSAQEEFSALRKSGDLNGMLSDSVAVGVMQIAYAGSAPSGAATDLSGLVNQLIAAYTTPEASSSTSGSTPRQSAAALSTNPGLAIIQTMENLGTFGPADSGLTATG
jgi:hypothetical protein